MRKKSITIFIWLLLFCISESYAQRVVPQWPPQATPTKCTASPTLRQNPKSKLACFTTTTTTIASSNNSLFSNKLLPILGIGLGTFSFMSWLNSSNQRSNTEGLPGCLDGNCPTGVLGGPLGADNYRSVITAQLAAERAIVEHRPEIARLGFTPSDSVSEVVAQGLGGELEERINHYSNSLQVQNSIEWASTVAFGSSMGLCKRMVMEAIANRCGPQLRRDSGGVYNCTPAWTTLRNNQEPLIREIRGAENAQDAVPELLNQCFINLKAVPHYSTMTARSAPKGAVLIFRGGPSGRGHMELKTAQSNQPGYISDFRQQFPQGNMSAADFITPPRYELIGVMIKPDLTANQSNNCNRGARGR